MDDFEGGGNQTEAVVLPKTPDLDGYASDVCDYNTVGNAKSKSSPISGRGVLVQPAQLSNSRQGQSILMDQSYIQQKRFHWATAVNSCFFFKLFILQKCLSQAYNIGGFGKVSQ